MAEADTKEPVETDLAPAPEPQDDEPEWTPEEERIAASFGWKPRDQFDDTRGEWRDPKAFIGNTRKVLFDSRDKIRSMEGKFSRIAAQMAKLQGNQRSQADADAQAQLAAAVEAGDLDAANKVLQQVRANQGDQGGGNPAFAAFKERNDWFNVDDEATAYAASLDARYAQQAGGAANITDPEAHFRKVEAGVKKAFPQLFGDEPAAKDGKGATPAPRAPLVARGGGADRPRDNGQVTVSTMSKEMREAANLAGVSAESYVKSYNAMMSKPASRNRAA